MRGMSVAVVAGAMVALTATSSSGAAAHRPGTERVTLSATGQQADDNAYGPQFSADGRFALFTAYASNLVPGDTNRSGDVFVRDLRKGTVERVDVASDGTQAAGGDSQARAISADGRYVLFSSNARNLVHWDNPPTNEAAQDVYLHDRRTGRTERISVALDGGSAFTANATMTPDARYIAFNAKADRMETNPRDIFGLVYLLDRRTGTVERISNRDRPDNPSLLQGLSDNGRYVAYTQLVPRSSYGRTWVHDRRTGTEEQVNVKPDGTPAQRYALPASLSADGRTIAFSYWGDEELVPGEDPGTGSTVYVRDLRKDVTRRVKAGPAEEDGISQPVLSPDGRYVTYEAQPRLADGRPGPANVYLRDLRTGSTRLVSESVTGGPVTDRSVAVYSVSAGAHRIGLGSESSQLVAGDTNGFYDGFVRRLP
ncbi:TolB family protein [Streptomyces sp. NPDC049541]|uniref:TolB family protein n=1 Tax=Streptomyces sp. NPDC049541 TaxID=3365594 RepID=UPI0037AAC2D3